MLQSLVSWAFRPWHFRVQDLLGPAFWVSGLFSLRIFVLRFVYFRFVGSKVVGVVD